MKEVVKQELTKLLDARIIYGISDGKWVSTTQCISKKSGMIVISNEKNKLIPTKTVTRWHVCINYRKLNNTTQKDHFPLPFIDQMLDRLVRKEFYYFLNRYSRYHQVLIHMEDQDKTTFTCPFGTYAFVECLFVYVMSL